MINNGYIVILVIKGWVFRFLGCLKYISVIINIVDLGSENKLWRFNIGLVRFGKCVWFRELLEVNLILCFWDL